MIYLHIPFCKQACTYCNFHFSTSSKGRSDLLAAMRQELLVRSPEWAAQPLQSIYFGGGTPSLLEEADLLAFFNIIAASAHPESPAFEALEITLEANPDDLKPDKIAMLAAGPVNRLSIGIQSFAEADLQLMKRAHSAQEAQQVLKAVQKAGFHNLSVDLIYGSPSTTDAIWKDNIQRLLDHGIPHIAAYALTVEPQTALAHQIKKGQLSPPDELRFERQFNQLIEQLGMAGYEHYEISNFALPGHYSRHNTAYWQGQSYVGIGPSAHSYSAKAATRSWNVANNALYTRAMQSVQTLTDYQQSPSLYSHEVLTVAQQYNEAVMLSLRTQWGLRLENIRAQFGTALANYCQQQLAPYLAQGYFEAAAELGHYRLSPNGRQLADGIAAAAFWVEE